MYDGLLLGLSGKGVRALLAVNSMAYSACAEAEEAITTSPGLKLAITRYKIKVARQSYGPI